MNYVFYPGRVGSSSFTLRDLISLVVWLKMLKGSSFVRSGVVFLLRREPLYHKLQYSKTPKFDAAAATLGVSIGAFGVYLGLSSLGSMGVDLSDLTVLCWYVALWLTAVVQFLALVRLPKVTKRVRLVVLLCLAELGVALWQELRLVFRLGFNV